MLRTFLKMPRKPALNKQREASALPSINMLVSHLRPLRTEKMAYQKQVVAMLENTVINRVSDTIHGQKYFHAVPASGVQSRGKRFVGAQRPLPAESS